MQKYSCALHKKKDADSRRGMLRGGSPNPFPQQKDNAVMRRESSFCNCQITIDISICLQQTHCVTKRRSRERLNLCTQVQRAFGRRLQKVRIEKGVLQKDL